MRRKQFYFILGGNGSTESVGGETRWGKTMLIAGPQMYLAKLQKVLHCSSLV